MGRSLIALQMRVVTFLKPPNTFQLDNPSSKSRSARAMSGGKGLLRSTLKKISYRLEALENECLDGSFSESTEDFRGSRACGNLLEDTAKDTAPSGEGCCQPHDLSTLPIFSKAFLKLWLSSVGLGAKDV